MNNAAKHFDPQLGIDIHMYGMPPGPLPTPHLGVVFDPFDYLPFIGASVRVNGVRQAVAGTGGLDIHIPLGVWAPPIGVPMGPQFNDELFMGSQTVLADGEPFSRLLMPALTCSLVGAIPPIRLTPKPRQPIRSLVLPTAVNLAVASNVRVGGPPTISLLGLATHVGMAKLGTLWRKSDLRQQLGVWRTKFDFSGKFHQLRKRLFENLPEGTLKCKVLRAEPVDIRNGSVFVEHEDFDLPGRLPLRWTRRYRSTDKQTGVCGPGWRTPADIRLEWEADGVVVFDHPEQMAFFPQAPAARGLAHAVRELQDGARLIDEGDTRVVQTKDGLRYVFVALRQPGRVPLLRIEDRCGNAWSFVYQNGELAKLVERGLDHQLGRVIRFTHEHGRLTQIRLHDPDTDRAHALVAYRYSDAGRLAAAIDPLGAPHAFAYDTEGRMVQHRDRTGLAFHYAFDGQSRVVRAWGEYGLYDYRFAYDDLLRQTEITDSRGSVSCVMFDENGLPLCELDALDGLTAFEYDDLGRTTAVVDPMGLRTQFDYDDHGNLRRLVRADGTTVAYDYDDDDQPVTVVDPGGGQWQQAYTAQGRLSAQTNPLGAVTQYTWDARGQLIACTDARGACTQLDYDRHGHLARITDPLGHQSRFTHDLHGRLLRQTDALLRTTHYDLDAKGRVVRIRQADGRSVQCAYDAEDQLIEHIDAAGARTRLAYIGLGSLARRIAPDGSTVEYKYDTEEQLIGVVNERGEHYTLVRDALGRIIEETDYWGQSRHYTYDAAGRLASATDPLGRRIAYRSDALGRIVSKTLPDPEHPEREVRETFGYTALGLLERTGNRYRQVRRTFDATGRLLVEEQDGFVLRYGYDEVGRRITRETSAGNRIAYAYDLRGLVASIAINDDAPIVLERDALGRTTREQLSETVQRAFAFDEQDRLTAQQVIGEAGPLFDTTYGYDHAGNLTERRDSGQGTDRYRYDIVGRLLQHTDPQGKIAHFLHDPAGDRLRTRVRQVPARKTAGGEDEPEQWTREGCYAQTDYVFDRAGNLMRRATQGDGASVTTFTWDANQRLVRSERGGEATTYTYDPLGRRVYKRNPTHTTWFFWEGDALAAEVTHENEIAGAPALTIAYLADALNVRKREQRLLTMALQSSEYVYYPGTFVSLAMLMPADGNGASAACTYHYHVDPNGCPTRMTDAAGRIAWSVSYEAWGQINAIHVARITSPLRFQGQYFDEETGLHYNLHRYYDPSTGQYIGQDPIGLSGGHNVYGYAPNPSGWFDPRGLSRYSSSGLDSWGGVVAKTPMEAAFLRNAGATFGGSSVYASAKRFGNDIVIQRSDLSFSWQNVRRMINGNSPFAQNASGEWEKINLHHVGRKNGKVIEVLRSQNVYNPSTGGPLHIPGPGAPVRDLNVREYWMERLRDAVDAGLVQDSCMKKVGLR